MKIVQLKSWFQSQKIKTSINLPEGGGGGFLAGGERSSGMVSPMGLSMRKGLTRPKGRLPSGSLGRAASPNPEPLMKASMFDGMEVMVGKEEEAFFMELLRYGE